MTCVTFINKFPSELTSYTSHGICDVFKMVNEYKKITHLNSNEIVLHIEHY